MSLVEVFQETKRIHGFCPCCGEIFRLSDATLFTKGAPPRTLFDDADRAAAKLQRSIERFEELEQEIRARATALGQKAARKKLRRIASYFVDHGLDPQDVKTLFDPVDYVAFRGLNGKKVASVEFIDRPAASKAREKLHLSLEKALKKGNVEWRTWRIDADQGSVLDEGK